MSCFSQTTTGDLDISTGNFAVVQDAAHVAAFKLGNLFGLGKGEWFRDTRIGVPYIQLIFVKNPNLQLVQSIIQRIVRAVPEITGIQDLELDFSPSQRHLDASFIASTIDGQSIAGGLGKPFIVLSDQAGS